MRVNLLKERNKAYTINWIEITIIITIILCLASIGIFILVQNNKITVKENEIASLENQIRILTVRVNEYNELKAKVEMLEEIKAKMDTLEYVWDDILLELGYVIPSQTMINRMALTDKTIAINGLAIDNQKVLDLLENMKLSPLYSDVKLVDIVHINDANYNITAEIVLEEGGQ